MSNGVLISGGSHRRAAFDLTIKQEDGRKGAILLRKKLPFSLSLA
jgi:hypothetical protein